jgi:hypothetical protein
MGDRKKSGRRLFVGLIDIAWTHSSQMPYLINTTALLKIDEEEVNNRGWGGGGGIEAYGDSVPCPSEPCGERPYVRSTG